MFNRQDKIAYEIQEWSEKNFLFLKPIWSMKHYQWSSVGYYERNVKVLKI